MINRRCSGSRQGVRADPLPQTKPGGSCPYGYFARLVLRAVQGRHQPACGLRLLPGCYPLESVRVRWFIYSGRGCPVLGAAQDEPRRT
jgi:hypothetical protein